MAAKILTQARLKEMLHCCTNKSGVTGVRIDKSRVKWIAEITLDGINKSIYYGDDFFAACCARKSAERKHGFHPNHGEAL